MLERDGAVLVDEGQGVLAFGERELYWLPRGGMSETRLDLEWEKLRLPIKIQVDTAAQAKANIDSAIVKLIRGGPMAEASDRDW